MNQYVVTVDLSFNVSTGKATFLDGTTAKKEAISEILEAYLHDQIGRGKDDRPADHRPDYRITLRLDLNGDIFHVTHNCGNEGLCAGILMAVLRDLP